MKVNHLLYMKNEEKLKRLTEISHEEWAKIVKDLSKFVQAKLFAKTLYGAHSEKELGVNPIEYYVDESIAKIYETWEWKEEYSLLEQLKRIAGSLISENVRKYKANSQTTISIDSEDLFDRLSNIEDESYSEDDDKLFCQILEKAAKGDVELELYVLAIHECSSYDEIEQVLGIDKATAYAQQRKLVKKIKSFSKNTQYELK